MNNYFVFSSFYYGKLIDFTCKLCRNDMLVVWGIVFNRSVLYENMLYKYLFVL